MSDDLAKKIPGVYAMKCRELPRINAQWTFTENNKAIQNGIEKGTWEIMDECLVIKYYNKEHGFAVLSFDGDNILIGENRWKNSKTFNWTLQKK